MADSVFMQIAEAARTRIIADTGLGESQVVILKDSKERERKNIALYPGVEIELIGDRYEPTGGTNVAENQSYSLQLAYVDEDRGDIDGDGLEGTQRQHTGYDALLDQRELLIDLFLRKRLTIADTRSCVYDCLLEPLVLFDRRAWRSRNLWRAPIVLRFLTRRVRA